MRPRFSAPRRSGTISPGNGYRVVTAPGQAPVYDRAVRTGIMRTGLSAHGGLIAPLWGGDWDNNFTLQTNDYPSGVALLRRRRLAL